MAGGAEKRALRAVKVGLEWSVDLGHGWVVSKRISTDRVASGLLAVTERETIVLRNGEGQIFFKTEFNTNPVMWEYLTPFWSEIAPFLVTRESGAITGWLMEGPTNWVHASNSDLFIRIMTWASRAADPEIWKWRLYTRSAFTESNTVLLEKVIGSPGDLFSKYATLTEAQKLEIKLLQTKE